MTDKEKEEVKQIESFLLCEVSDNSQEIKERISKVATYHTRLSHLLPKAKRELRAKKTSEIKETIIAIAKEQCLSAKVQNALLDSICEDEQYVVDKLERLQSSCVHDIDANRSVLSFMKTELSQINYTG